jgi:hypothetical protein
MVILTLLALLPNDKARQSEVQDLMRQIAALLDKLDAGNDTLVSDISPSLLTIEVGKLNSSKSWTAAVNAILEKMPQVSFNSRRPLEKVDAVTWARMNWRGATEWGPRRRRQVES